jgi:nucleobase:cation symporter-1, NCS1 family
MSTSSLIEKRSIDFVPLAERHGKVWHLWPIWFAGDAHLATLATGALGIAMGLNLFWSIVAIIGGCAMGTFFMAFHAAQGPQLGLPQMIQSRPQFGYRGALLVWVVALVTYVGYNAFNQLLAAQTVHELTGMAPRPTMAVFTLFAAIVALIGYDLIHRAQRVLAFTLIVILTLFSVGAILAVPLPAGQLDPHIFVIVPFALQFFAAAAYQLSWSIYVSDYSRYLPPDVGVKAAFWWTFAGAMIGGVMMMAVGALAIAAFPHMNVIAAARTVGDQMMPGFGVVLLVVAFVGLLTATSLNFYGASLTMLSIADSFMTLRNTTRERLVSLVIAVAAASVLSFSASDDFMHDYELLLSVLIYLFTPWTAINLIDFYIVRNCSYSITDIFDPDGIYGRWNAPGLIAYAIGFAAMVPFFSTGLFTGVAARALGGVDISMLIGLPVSAFAYLWLCRGQTAGLATISEARVDHKKQCAEPRID